MKLDCVLWTNKTHSIARAQYFPPNNSTIFVLFSPRIEWRDLLQAQTVVIFHVEFFILNMQVIVRLIEHLPLKWIHLKWQIFACRLFFPRPRWPRSVLAACDSYHSYNGHDDECFNDFECEWRVFVRAWTWTLYIVISDGFVLLKHEQQLTATPGTTVRSRGV